MVQPLRGSHEARLDDRNRVAIPSKMLEALRALEPAADQEKPLEVIVSLDLAGRVGIFTKTVYRELEDHLASGPAHDPDWEEVRSVVLGTADDQVVDKQGRIRVLPLLAEQMGLIKADEKETESEDSEDEKKNEGEKEEKKSKSTPIVIQGAGNHLQLITIEDWKKDMAAFKTKVRTLKMP